MVVATGVGIVNAQTPYPTMRDTTPTPTMAPIALVDLCSPGDKVNFELNEEYFDFDLGVCGLECSLDILREQDEINTCVRNCFSVENGRSKSLQSEPYSLNCGECFGAYAACMVLDCECSAARETSVRCRACSLASCEPDFTNCTGGLVVPEYYEGPEEELDMQRVIIYASAGGAGAFLAMGGVLFLRYRRVLKRRTRNLTKDEKESMKTARFDAKLSAGQAPPPASARRPDMETSQAPGAGGPRVYLPSMSSAAAAPAKLASRVSARVSANFGRKAPPQVPTRNFAQGFQTRHANPVGHSFRVTMPFVSTHEDEITLRTNAIVTILEILSDDWVMVRENSTGKEGMTLSGNLVDV
ncbi:Hypothetical Protein FCC1311_016432 [Hondaea fermentalgiana]|uniref:SH3 domain-containing protein n=1 Tax=Hondaea fermentalgiana TaxID=2315210 RepID=A0A2R5G4E3_9STRA|nr:Hypothetical Protein FCC1311_016432 [Hondaea fermentalgiana]|eukprot:GBG25425.1 Hypothetical Protein FCC1311_016432 [Hondaea fermentalgiana]